MIANMNNATIDSSINQTMFMLCLSLKQTKLQSAFALTGTLSMPCPTIVSTIPSKRESNYSLAVPCLLNSFDLTSLVICK